MMVWCCIFPDNIMPSGTQKKGAFGEDIAVAHLRALGYVVHARNVVVRGGEIDIVAEKDVRGQRTLIFVEVKTRSSDAGSAEAATRENKMRQLFHAARGYCVRENIVIERTPIQFEHVSVILKKNTPAEVRVYVIEV